MPQISSRPPPGAEKFAVNNKAAGKGAAQISAKNSAARNNTNKFTHTFLQPELPAAFSGALAADLRREIESLDSADQAALWAQRRLAAKNQLSAADARQVEEALSVRVAVIPAAGTTTNETTSPDDVRTLAKNTETSSVDNCVLSFPKPRRLRDRGHIRHVMTQACLICGRRPSDPHHLRFAQSRALSRKVSDEFTVPLCRTHHREVHRHGDEETWWQKIGIDPLSAARTLWLETHPLPRADATAANDEVRTTEQPASSERSNGKELHAIAMARTSKSQRSKADRTAGKP